MTLAFIYNGLVVKRSKQCGHVLIVYFVNLANITDLVYHKEGERRKDRGKQ